MHLEIIDRLWENRSKTAGAAVHRFGCAAIGKSVPADAAPLMTLIGLLLSSQTHDQTTFAAVKKLVDRSLHKVESLAKASIQDIEDAIYPVSFYHRKAGNIQKIARTFAKGQSFPRTIEEFQELDGIGPKMAHLAMQIIYDECHGISVDTHVHRISRLLGLAKDARTPEETRKQLEQVLPKLRPSPKDDDNEWNVWTEINPLLVALGQTICLPRSPKCSECFLADLCPSSISTSSVHKRQQPKKETPSASLESINVRQQRKTPHRRRL